jgi:hypothetical protein
MTAQTDHHFIGNGAYCYTNGLAMLLASAGARWDPSILECLTAVGLGARWWRREEMIYFSLLPPDRGVSLALDALGVTVEEMAAEAAGRPLSPRHSRPLQLTSKKPIQGGLVGQLINFGLPLSALRAHDLAAFLRPGYAELAAVKARQAIAFIDAFSQALGRQWIVKRPRPLRRVR